MATGQSEGERSLMYFEFISRHPAFAQNFFIYFIFLWDAKGDVFKNVYTALFHKSK